MIFIIKWQQVKTSQARTDWFMSYSVLINKLLQYIHTYLM